MRRPRRLALAACSVVALGIALPASGAGPASSLRQQAQRLTQENSANASHSRAAVLMLYALDSRLTEAQGRLAAVRAQAAAVDRQAAETRRELRIARGVLAASQALAVIVVLLWYWIEVLTFVTAGVFAVIALYLLFVDRPSERAN